MNKSQLVEAVASEAKISKVCAKRAVDAVLNVTVDSLRKGERLTLSGFGSFAVNEQPERLGRNPRTGATVRIAARRVVRFRASLDLE